MDVILSAAVPASTLAAANYDTNPAGTVAPPGVVTQYFDVYRQGAVLAGADSITIRFYGIQSTGAQVYAWSAAQSTWVLATGQVIDQFRGAVTVTITTISTPNSANLGGLPFVLVEPTPTAVLAAAPIIISPAGGERDVPLTPTFSWTAVAGAAGYYFEFADNANFVAPLVKLDGDLGRLITTAYAYVTELPYSTAYYWRVKAVSGTTEAGNLAQSAWVSGVFITMDEPEEPTPPIVIEEAPTLPDIIIEQPDITITSPDIVVPLPDVVETPITPSWIYVIIGVGAVLVIALLVLIVRTRRVA